MTGDRALVDEDALVAAVDLVGRSGATAFEVGYLDADVPSADARWWATATYKGTRVISEDHAGPAEAAEGLARRILTGGTCQHCGGYTIIGDLSVSLAAAIDGSPYHVCRWARTGRRWDRTCGARPNRAERRRQARPRRKGRP